MEEIIEYLKQLENPMKIGFDETKQIWTPPVAGGFDKNQIGYGLDMRYGPVAEILRLRKLREGKIYLTAEEEKHFREDYIRTYLGRIFNKNTATYCFSSKGFRVMTPKRKTIAFGLLYRGDGKKLWNKGNAIYDAFWHGSDEEFEQAVLDFYTPILPERVRNHNIFWNNKATGQRRVVKYAPRMIPSRFEINAPETLRNGGYMKRKLVKRNLSRNRYYNKY